MAALLKDEIIRRIEPMITYGCADTSVYFIGSLSAIQYKSFDRSLSDIDLLFVPACDSLDDYVYHFEQVTRISIELNQSRNWLVDCFVMSARVAGIYFKVLPVIAGDDKLRDEDIAFGDGLSEHSKEVAIPSDKARKKIYLAKSLRFYHEYIYQLPLADTGKAKKVAKLLLRYLKLMICAEVGVRDLTRVEHELFSASTFTQVGNVFFDVFGVRLDIDDAVMQRALDGDTVNDWPEWMIAQDGFARELMSFYANKKMTVNESRFYEAVAQVRDMLNKNLKDVLATEDDKTRSGLIAEYADNAANAVVKLAISGVSSLVGLESQTTPNIVSESYGVLVEHLKGKTQSMRILAASVVLLEYAFEESICALEQNLDNKD